MESINAGQTGDSTEHAKLLWRRTEASLRDIGDVIGSSSAEGAAARGKMFELVGFFPEAINAYSDALAFDPSLNEARACLAQSQLKAGQVSAGLDTITELAARQPDFTIQATMTEERISALTILGDALLADGQIAEAQTAYKEALKINEQDSYAAGRLAQIFLVTNEPREAIKLRDTFATNPRFADLTVTLGIANTNIALLPKVSSETLFANLGRVMVGRPVIVNGELRCAPLVEGDDRWCDR